MQEANSEAAVVHASPLDAVVQTLTGAAPQVEPEQDDDNSSVTTVPCIQMSDSDQHKGGTCFHVELFGSGCLDCKHLVDDAEVDYKKCHFQNGNVACPAAYIRISFIGEQVKWESRVRKVQELPKGENRTNALLALIDKAKEIESDSLRSYVMGLLGF